MRRKNNVGNVRRIALASMLLISVHLLLTGCGNRVKDDTAPVVNTETETAPASTDSVVVTPVAKKTATSTPSKLPVLYLTMDDNTVSPIVLDASGSKNDQMFLDPGGDPNTKGHSVPGITKTALTFDGVDDTLIVSNEQIGGIFPDDTPTDFSIAFWWRSAAEPFPEGYREILGNHSNDNGGIVLYQRGNAAGTDQRIYMNCYAPNQGPPVLAPTADIVGVSGLWHHYVFQRAGTALQAWCNGTLLKSIDDPNREVNIHNGNDFRIGTVNSGANGTLDEFRLYNRALSRAEIERLARRPSEKEDIFSLGEMLSDLTADSTSSPLEIERAKNMLQKELAAQEKSFPKTIGDKVELLAFRYTLVKENVYEMAFAFRATKKLSRDYQIYVYGDVDRSHTEAIKALGIDGRRQKWGFAPSIPTSTWNPGDVVVLRKWVQAADVPYLMSLNLMYQDSDKGWLAMDPVFAPLGWQASL